ncbi:hypothetical protein HAX54_013375 [Datura stramonium]|uniref:Uncharacterized protein n=1 Tax=Datura stramonium TaxID=4076 RepID=A0ABS8TN85_DATST|nr:hypothetical protein [Datura stramonium]
MDGRISSRSNLVAVAMGVSISLLASILNLLSNSFTYLFLGSIFDRKTLKLKQVMQPVPEHVHQFHFYPSWVHKDPYATGTTDCHAMSASLLFSPFLSPLHFPECDPLKRGGRVVEWPSLCPIGGAEFIMIYLRC